MQKRKEMTSLDIILLALITAIMFTEVITHMPKYPHLAPAPRVIQVRPVDLTQP